ncbi:E3 SUMO-protein ligase NSE2-like [Rhinoderma darwinii]|uniref:E3 SUMO-protein ligase NSE2-like n=1 Tax=Rhinoderma darwinii TaxID=43563 RepID=UPI003F674A8D
MAAHSSSLHSTSAVEASLSSLRNCQAYIDTGMDITTGVALDLLQSGCDAADVDSMETVMLEYVSMSRDLNQYISAVEETMRKVKRDSLDEIPDLKKLVHKTYVGYQRKNTDEALKKNDTFLQFKGQLKDLRNPSCETYSLFYLFCFLSMLTLVLDKKNKILNSHANLCLHGYRLQTNPV